MGHEIVVDDGVLPLPRLSAKVCGPVVACHLLVLEVVVLIGARLVLLSALRRIEVTMARIAHDSLFEVGCLSSKDRSFCDGWLVNMFTNS